jgi:predicted amidophosphoribosyltransferase
MRSFLKSLSSILFDESLLLEIPTNAFKTSRFGITVYAGNRLTPELSRLAVQAKEGNDLLARKFLAKLIIDAMRLTNCSEFDLIPIPSRVQADRYRGIKHIQELVKEVNKVRPVRSHEILRHVKKVRDQSTLTHFQRLENLEGAFAVNERTKIPTKGFLLDDLVTSGATMKAAAEALQARNIELLGVLTACATTVFTE